MSADKEEVRMNGTIKYANSNGYGFIDTPQKIDFFFHHTQFEGDWKKLLQRYISGEVISVTFNNDFDAPSGPRALNVKVV